MSRARNILRLTMKAIGSIGWLVLVLPCLAGCGQSDGTRVEAQSLPSADASHRTVQKAPMVTSRVGARFDERGIEVARAAWRWSLSARSWGCAERRVEVARAAPVTRDNR